MCAGFPWTYNCSIHCPASWYPIFEDISFQLKINIDASRSKEACVCVRLTHTRMGGNDETTPKGETGTAIRGSETKITEPCYTVRF